MQQNKAGSRRAPAYSALLNHLVALQARSGYTSAGQIRDLTAAELGAVIRHEPTVLADAMTDAQRVAVFASLLRDPQLTDQERSTAFGACAITYLEKQAKTYLLGEVQAEIARDEDNRTADESDEYYGQRLGMRA